MKKVVFLSIALMILASCTDQFVNDPDPKPKLSKKSELKLAFSESLALSMANSESLRLLLKNEALKKFDNDFDILYHMIKDVELPEGQTVRNLIVSNIKDESLLLEIEREIPLLTIFIPELPGDSFSANLWDTRNQIPEVAFTQDHTNDIAMIKADGTLYTLSAELIPGFPVVVVKENERVVKKEQNSEANGGSFRTKGNDIEFQFLDDAFNGALNPESSNERSTATIDQKLIDAYTTYQNTDGWHRDYIYYDITPSQPNGEFKYNFIETITSFRLAGNPVSMYNKISDQSGDPKTKSGFVFGSNGNPPSQTAAWTEGNFEFKVKILYNAKNGAGTEGVAYFSRQAHEIFQVIYKKLLGNVWTVESVSGFKEVNPNIQFINWDLDQYSTSIKIEIEEVDITTTTTITDTRSVEFATNFGIDAEIDVWKKFGLKFGASQKNTQTQSIQKSYTQGNDPLGFVIVNFADNVIVSQTGQLWNTREYQTGEFVISVEPKRVQ